MRFFFNLLVVVFLILAACTGTEQTAEREKPDQDFSALEELYWERLERSRMNFTRADVDFMTDMIVHHAQALIMSRMAPENGASQNVQTLAARIINAQDDEIATMQKWLRDRGQPVPVIHIEELDLIIHTEEPDDGEAHEGHHAHHGNAHHDISHHDDMPGMLTQEQLGHLAGARGPAFDRLFLEYMIEHHEGAVIMVRELFDSDGAANDPEAFDLASDIHAEQVTEINRMRFMLEQMAAEND